MGQERAGFYSNTWLENLTGADIHNADAIHPEWQQRTIGDRVPLARVVAATNSMASDGDEVHQILSYVKLVGDRGRLSRLLSWEVNNAVNFP